MLTYVDAAAREKAAKADKAAAGETIKSELRSRKKTTLMVGDHPVKLSKVAGGSPSTTTPCAPTASTSTRTLP